MINFFIFLSALLALAQSQACNSIAINGCASFDTSNTYALADCGCLSCNPGLTLAVGLLSCCDSTFQHCLTCDSSNICQACQVNYYLNLSNNCTICSSSMLNCLTCSNLSTCTSCTVNFTLNSGVCSDCSSLISGCLTCSSPSTCSTCQPTHILSANNSCQPCNTSFADCSKCTPTGCTLCNSYYGLNSSNLCVYCTDFIDYCAYCHDIYSPCLGCHDGRFVNTSTLICDLCSNYMINCSTCPNNSYCRLCQLGYGFNDTHDCVRCDLYFANCSSCFDIHSCSSCISTMVLNDSNICVPCYEFMPYCDTCMSNRTNCSSCNLTGMGIDNTSNPVTCVPCNSKYPQCIDCTMLTFCTVCINNSYILVWQSVDRQVCFACSQKVQGCYTCTQTSVCLSCLTTKQYLFNSSSNTCIRCSQYLDNCTTCNNMFYCIGCQDHRFALARLNNNVNTQVCQLCSDFMLNCLYCQSSTFCSLCLAGQLINSNKGCSGVKGCIEIYPLSPVATNCRSCDPLSFKTTPENGKCICASGKLVGNQCTSVFGCIGVKVSKGKVVCISCDRNSKLMLIGQLCECLQYYQLSGETCVQTCGDGYLISYQCDDGNQVNGDGCSDKCKIEDSFACRNDNSRYPTSPASQCQFKGKIELVLNSIDKILEPNTVEVIFDFVPYDPKLDLMNLMANFNITADACKISSIKISSGQLHVIIEYSKDITGQNSTLSATFDSQYILSPDFSLSFSMVESNGIPLKYSTNQAINSTVILMIKVLSLLALGVFVVGSFAFKMIGLQTLFTIQISWFTLATSKYYKSMFAHLHYFNYSYGQISSIFGSDTDVSINGYQRLGFNGGIGDILLLIIVDWGLFIFYCGVVVYRLIKQKKLQEIVGKRAIIAASKFKILKNDCENKIQATGKIAYSIYNWALFPFVIGFQFHFFHTISLYILSSSHSHVSFQMIMLCLSMILTSFLFFRELIIRDEECESIMLRKSNKNIYIPNFLVYNIIIFFLMSLLLNSISKLVYFAVITILSIQAIYVLIFTPYNSNFDNFCLVFNHIAILFNLVWIMIKGLPFYDSFVQGLCVYAFIGLSCTVLALGLIRSLISIKRTYFPNIPFPSKTVAQQTKEDEKPAITSKVIKNKLEIDTSGYDKLKSMKPFRKKINRFRTDEANITQKQSFRHKITHTLIDHP